MPTDDTLSSLGNPVEPPRELPENHLAVIIEDVLAAVDERLGTRPAGHGPDLRAIVIYGWATGAFSARDVASGASHDDGLAYLWRGVSPRFEAVRGLRQSDLRRLELQLATAFDLCRGAGFTRLGEIDLGDSPASDAAAPFSGAELAGDLLARSRAADAEEDRELAAAATGLPVGLASQHERQRVLRSLLTRPAPGAAPEGPAAADQSWGMVGGTGFRPQRRAQQRGFATVGASTKGLAMLVAILVGGLLLVRWVGATLASPSAQGRGGRLEETVTGLAPSSLPTAQDDGSEVPAAAIREEAFRLAGDALDAADLEAARDLYVLAAEAMPGDRETLNRRRQVETAIGIRARQDGWAEAVADLEELWRAAPSSRAVLAAYVEALVGAGRAARSAGGSSRALDLCREAVRLMPSHAGAQACAGAGTPDPAPVRTLTQPAPPTARPTPMPLTPAVPVGAVSADVIQSLVPPLRGTGQRPDAVREPLAVLLLGSCAASGRGAVVRASGMVSAAGSEVTDFEVDATVRSPSGEVVATVKRAYRGPRFSVEQAAGRGSHVLAVVVSKDGLPSGGGVARVTC